MSQLRELTDADYDAIEADVEKDWPDVEASLVEAKEQANEIARKRQLALLAQQKSKTPISEEEWEDMLRKISEP